MKFMKTLLCFGAMLVMLTACGGGETKEAEQTTAAEETAETGDTGWTIEYIDSSQGAELTDISVVMGYTSAGTEEFSTVAPEGKEYLLVKLICEKTGGQEVIDWEKLTLTDSEGNEYKRIDDAFISDLNMKRLPGTALNFGTNEGFIAFEVNEGASGYTLVYPFEAGNFEIQF